MRPRPQRSVKKGGIVSHQRAKRYTTAPSPVSLPWRNPCPKASAIQEDIGESGQKRVRIRTLEGIKKQKEINELYEQTKNDNWDDVSRTRLFEKTCPNLTTENVAELWSPALELKKLGRQHYEEQVQLEHSKRWLSTDEWTRLKGMKTNPDQRVTAFHYKSTGAKLQVLSGYTETPSWQKLLLTPRTRAWAKQKLFKEDKFGPQFFQAVDEMERMKRIREHIKLKMRARRRFNLEKERQFVTDYQRRVIQPSNTKAKPSARSLRMDRLSSLTPRKILPDFEADLSEEIAEKQNNATSAFDKLADDLSPLINMYLLQKEELPPLIASLSRKQAIQSQRIQQRENRIRAGIRNFVIEDIQHFEDRLMHNQQQDETRIVETQTAQE